MMKYTYSFIFLSLAFAIPAHGDLQMLWYWNASVTFPMHNQGYNTPLVVPLGQNGEELSVVFNTFSGSMYTEDGILRAVDAATGVEKWSINSSLYYTAPIAGIAAADIDGDGYVEIIAPAGLMANTGTFAFEHDGTFKWYSPYPSPASFSRTITIADLDYDGDPEVICGKTVLTSAGVLKWEGTGTAGLWQAVAADLDGEGGMEVIESATVYRKDGTIWWTAPFAASASAAVGDVNGDGLPEIVFNQTGNIYLYTGSGSLIWGPVTFPDGSAGAPCLADFDGDDLPEIAIAGRNWIIVFENDGLIKWQSPFVDTSSFRNGCSAFDFDGDGDCELTAQDHTYLTIFSGVDGAILHQVAHSSGTLIEYPVISDLDNDGQAEIVASCNNYAFGSVHGLIAYEPVAEIWQPSRKIWNQYGYHVTNISDSGSVPTEEEMWWLGENTFRAQRRIPQTPSPSPTETPTETPAPTETPDLTSTPSPTPAQVPSSGPLGISLLMLIASFLLASRFVKPKN